MHEETNGRLKSCLDDPHSWVLLCTSADLWRQILLKKERICCSCCPRVDRILIRAALKSGQVCSSQNVPHSAVEFT